MSSDFEKAYMDEYAASFFPPEMPADQLPEVMQMRPGALEGEMKAIPQTGLQRIMEQTGLTLQQIGDSLDAIGKVKIGGIEIGLRDLLPFVGSTEEVPISEMRTASGKTIQVLSGSGQPVAESAETVTVQKGTPQVLQQMGRGISPVVGKGMTTELRPEAKEAGFDVIDVAGIGKAAAVGTKAAAKKVTKAVKRVPNTELQGAE